MPKLPMKKLHAREVVAGGGEFSKGRSAVASPSSIYTSDELLRTAGTTTTTSPLAAALSIFDKATEALGLRIEDKAKLLNVGRTKYFEIKKQLAPELDVDLKDRLGYFLAIFELSGRLVGSPEAWLKAPNKAPLFGGRTPLDRIQEGRMETLLATLTYLKGTYGGWA